MLLLFLVTTTLAQRQCQEKKDTDYGGFDLAIIEKVSTSGDCCNRCSAFLGCLAYTWTGSTQKCHLKATKGPRAQSGYVSGDVSASNCTSEADTDYSGSDLFSKSGVKSFEECCSLCGETPSCSAFSWASPSAPDVKEVCYLKRNGNGKSARKGWFAGLRNNTRAEFNIFVNETRSFAHFWERCVGSGHAALAKRADYQAYLKLARETAGFRLVRFHGLLDDDMHVVTGPAPYKFNFTEINQIFKYFISIGVRPLVELSFMPYAMASGTKTVFYYKGNVTPPKSFQDWGRLIEELVKNFKDTFGESEVESWMFEVWNEPNLDGFWNGTKEQYFELYEYAATAVKKVSQKFSVGGPASAGLSWIPEFIQFCKGKQLPLDFISTHHYPAQDSDNYVNDLKRAQSAAKPYPFVITEYSALLMDGSNSHDSEFAAAFVGSMVPQLEGVTDVLSYWTFSDVFEEGGLNLHPFSDTYGLITINGIPKPGLRAYELLHQLSTTALHVQKLDDTSKVTAVATIEGKTVKVLVSNYDYYQRPPPFASVCFTLDGTEAVQKATISRVDRDHANAYTTWKLMGMPDPLSASDLSKLLEASEINEEPLPAAAHIHNTHSGPTICFNLPPWGVALVTVDLQ